MTWLILSTLAILWLLHRVTGLLKIPVFRLISILGVDVPDTPVISIDSVTATSVSLHWAVAPRYKSVSKYVVEICGRRIGESDRIDSGVTLKDLQPNRLYSLDIFAVNSSNYRSGPSTVRFHTRRLSEVGLPPELGLSPRRSSILNKARSRANSKTGKLAVSSAGSSSIYTIESLTREVEQVHLEIDEIMAQTVQADAEFDAAHAALQDDLENLQERRRADDQQRAALKSELKAIEDAKRAIQAQTDKMQRRRDVLQVEVDRKKQALSQYESEASALRAQIFECEANLDMYVEIVDHFDDADPGQLMGVDEELSVDSRRKSELVAEIQNLEAKRAQDLQALNSLKSHTDELGEVLNSMKPDLNSTSPPTQDVNVRQAIDRAEWVPQDLKQEIHMCFDKDVQLEEEWQKTQKELELRYVKVFKLYGDAKTNYKHPAESFQLSSSSSSSIPTYGPNFLSSDMTSIFFPAHSTTSSASSLSNLYPNSTTASLDQRRRYSHSLVDQSEPCSKPYENVNSLENVLLPSNLFSAEDTPNKDLDKPLLTSSSTHKGQAKSQLSSFTSAFTTTRTRSADMMEISEALSLQGNAHRNPATSRFTPFLNSQARHLSTSQQEPRTGVRTSPRKFSSMFFFGKPKGARNTSPEPELSHAETDQLPIGSKRPESPAAHSPLGEPGPVWYEPASTTTTATTAMSNKPSGSGKFAKSLAGLFSTPTHFEESDNMFVSTTNSDDRLDLAYGSDGGGTISSSTSQQHEAVPMISTSNRSSLLHKKMRSLTRRSSHPLAPAGGMVATATAQSNHNGKSKYSRLHIFGVGKRVEDEDHPNEATCATTSNPVTANDRESTA